MGEPRAWEQGHGDTKAAGLKMPAGSALALAGGGDVARWRGPHPFAGIAAVGAGCEHHEVPGQRRVVDGLLRPGLHLAKRHRDHVSRCNSGGEEEHGRAAIPAGRARLR